ncbi:50S ribosomal protein L9 [bioreactor metagenome]|uniref:50S ribosomal protein L9 n=1 Tax=bioreactor metagenome TaxID=1076179 RepID=A0A644T5Z1_9ZZZZ|nr:50S ribosomal protein L9 [Candidatus Elulimicrobiales bacterium]
MKVIFIQNVAKQGRIGEIKEVADGFAMNVLIPKKQAVIATPGAIRKLEEDKKNKVVKQELDKNLFFQALKDLQKILDEKSSGVLEISGHKNDGKGNLFSQIKEIDIVEAIFSKIKVSLNPGQIILPKEPIKKVGEYEIEIKEKELSKKLKIEVL